MGDIEGFMFARGDGRNPVPVDALIYRRLTKFAYIFYPLKASGYGYYPRRTLSEIRKADIVFCGWVPKILRRTSVEQPSPISTSRNLYLLSDGNEKESCNSDIRNGQDDHENFCDPNVPNPSDKSFSLACLLSGMALIGLGFAFSYSETLDRLTCWADWARIGCGALLLLAGMLLTGFALSIAKCAYGAN
jgi:hypothetical protein